MFELFHAEVLWMYYGGVGGGERKELGEQPFQAVT
jgi:hypothetical protein